MSRKVFDKLTSAGGAAVVVVLLIAGGLLTWGHSFVNSNVRSQLAMQQIYFPPKAVWAHAKPGTEITPAMIPYLEQYSGQELLTGQQAEAYANHFIRIHLSEMAYGGVYSKVSAASLADPTNAALAAETQLVFRGTTLRGLLLEAYAFWMIGQIMLWGAIASFVMAFVIAVLVGLGIRHASLTPEERQLLISRPAVAAS
ncbi:MAG: hypothetical protein ACLP50_07525 [Solirubrobacteraceae bacterium]